MSSDVNQEVTFDAIRQFKVVPDRRYRVERRDDALHFRTTGSQFDIQWLVRGARPLLGDRVADRFERSSRGGLILGGIGIAGAAVLLILLLGALAVSSGAPLRRPHFTGFGVLVFAFVVGVVMIMAGISSRSEGASRPRHDFSLPVADIVEVAVLDPQSEVARRGEPQVARLHLDVGAGGTIKLGIPTASDLETARSVIPRLAA